MMMMMIARADKSIASLSLRKVKARLVVEWLVKALGKRWVGRLSLLRSETFSIRKRTKARTVSQRKRLRSAGTTPRRRVKTLNTNTNIIISTILLLSLSFFLFLRHLIRPKIKKFQGCSSPSHHVFGRRKASLFTHTQHANSNVCYSIFIPRCRCAEDFFEEIFEGFRENRRSRASCRSA